MKKIRIKMTIKLWRNGKAVANTGLFVKTRILETAQVRSWDRALLKIVYDSQLNYENVAYCSDIKDLKKTLSAFTELRLINYIKEKNAK